MNGDLLFESHPAQRFGGVGTVTSAGLRDEKDVHFGARPREEAHRFSDSIG